MAKYFGLLICALALVQLGSALDCYSCVSSSSDKNCEEFSDKSKITVAPCGKTVGSSFKPACIKKVLEDKTTKMTNTTRMCIIMKVDSNQEMECKSSSDRYTVPVCEICEDNLCNGSSQARYSVLTVLSSIAAFFAVKHML